ncbi:hypothetical protein ACFLTI_03840 [Bacteroidota bacterium]
MKKTIKLLSGTLILLFVFSSFTIGQTNETDFTTRRKISFHNNSETREVKINVDKDLISGDEGIDPGILKPTFTLNINIIGEINSGKISIEIYDPKGVKKGKFSITAEKPDPDNKTYMRDQVSGKIDKKISQPLKGDWLIKIIPEKAGGDVVISSSQNYQSYTVREK